MEGRGEESAQQTEADHCYWIANEPKVRGKKRLDLRVETRPAWRLEGRSLTFHVLGPDGHYVEPPMSPTFPFLTPADLLQHLALASPMEENAFVRQFRAWVHPATRSREFRRAWWLMLPPWSVA